MIAGMDAMALEMANAGSGTTDASMARRVAHFCRLRREQGETESVDRRRKSSSLHTLVFRTRSSILFPFPFFNEFSCFLFYEAFHLPPPPSPPPLQNIAIAFERPDRGHHLSELQLPLRSKPTSRRDVQCRYTTTRP
jgi:hypothetical protein